MTNKSTKKALALSIISLVVCVSMLVGTTFAWFTDSVTSANNKIIAGNLKLDLEVLEKDNTTWTSVKDSKAPIFNYTNWEPGYTEVKVLKVQNEGSLALKWKATFKSAAPLGDLANVIDVYVMPGVTAYSADRAVLDGWTKVGTLSEFANTLSTTTYGQLTAKGTATAEATLGLAFKMQETADNTYQKASLGAFDITILATQLNYESDSFDTSYDINAKYDENNSTDAPVFFVKTAADLKAALTPTVSNDEAVVILDSDITLADGETWTPLALEAYTGTVRNIVIDGQGHSIKGLNAPLIGHAYFGNTSIEIKNLTLTNATIVDKHYNGLGSGAFVAYADNCSSVVLSNCHLTESSVTSTGDFTGIGGLVGYSSSNLTITDCSVTNCTITGAQNSAGAIAGHVSAGHDTVITNAKVIGCTVKGERADKTGYVVGTANNGDTTITTNAACANNTVFDVADSTTIYGRLVGGTLTVNGVAQ